MVGAEPFVRGLAGVLVLAAVGCRAEPQAPVSGPLMSADLSAAVSQGAGECPGVQVASGHDERRFDTVLNSRVREVVLNVRVGAGPLDGPRAQALVDAALAHLQVALQSPAVSRVGRFAVNTRIWLRGDELTNTGVHYRVGNGFKGSCLVSVGPGEAFFHKPNPEDGSTYVLMRKFVSPPDRYYVLVRVEETARTEHDRD